MSIYQDATTKYKNRRITGRALDIAVNEYRNNNGAYNFNKLKQAVKAYEYWVNVVKIKK